MKFEPNQNWEARVIDSSASDDDWMVQFGLYAQDSDRPAVVILAQNGSETVHWAMSAEIRQGAVNKVIRLSGEAVPLVEALTLALVRTLLAGESALISDVAAARLEREENQEEALNQAWAKGVQVGWNLQYNEKGAEIAQFLARQGTQALGFPEVVELLGLGVWFGPTNEPAAVESVQIVNTIHDSLAHNLSPKQLEQHKQTLENLPSANSIFPRRNRDRRGEGK